MTKKINFTKVTAMSAWEWEENLRRFGAIVVTLGRSKREIAVIKEPRAVRKNRAVEQEQATE